MSYAYVASPYTHDDPDVMQQRFLLAELYCANALRANHYVYSPIVHCHEMAKRHKLPTNHEFWAYYNCAMLAPSTRLEVLQLPGWEISKGVADEIDFAERRHIPVLPIPFDHEWLKTFQTT